MCMVSVVMDYGQQIPIQQWNTQSWFDYQEVLRRLEALDKKLDQPDCHDPRKAKWMQAVEERLAKLEGKNRLPKSPLRKQSSKATPKKTSK